MHTSFQPDKGVLTIPQAQGRALLYLKTETEIELESDTPCVLILNSPATANEKYFASLSYLCLI